MSRRWVERWSTYSWDWIHGRFSKQSMFQHGFDMDLPRQQVGSCPVQVDKVRLGRSLCATPLLNVALTTEACGSRMSWQHSRGIPVVAFELIPS